MRTTQKTCRACGRSFVGEDVFCPHDGSRLLASSDTEEVVLDPLISTTLDGRYRILRVIGEGGMGIVYEGEHTLIERRVAIKVLRENFCRRPDAVERFRREAKSASRIGHPNIVDVLDFGETPGGAHYFVMEMLEGQDLADALARTGALNPARAVSIIHQCCHALAAAHDKGIVHRDLKPENILLIERDSVRDFVKIVDFGVAKMSELEWNLDTPGAAAGARSKLTRTGVVFGTPEYMSPEQATGLTPDHRVDIYALGVTLYELLTGRVPFEGESFMSVLSKHANKAVPALSEVDPTLEVSAELEDIVTCALNKDRDERFQSMQEMASALEQTLEWMAFAPRHSAPPPGKGRTRASSSLPTSVMGPIAARASTRAEPIRMIARGRGLALGIGIAALAVAGAAAVYAASSEAPAGQRGRAMKGSPPDVQAADAQAGDAPARDGQGRVAEARYGTESDLRTAPPAAITAAPPGPQAANSAARPPGSGAGARGVSTSPSGELGRELTTSAPTRSGLDLVVVRVTTQPPGARVRIVGAGEVCAKTPCSFEAVRGAPLSLQAQRGSRQTTQSIRPSDTTELYLVLETKADKAASPNEPPPQGDGLKVPEMFRDAVK